ncbi:MAG: bifunctional 3-deoxy-7-phosphoheptulonate synthase/chorismate mutase type II [Bacteroidia bacterium]|nr:bifunctional 3-deoxy-7-phosphoheptulonate synthase/chorismate mutase type II [Bacteroidia bacterium]
MIKQKIFIAGPCSVESYQQLEETALFFKKHADVKYIRAGVWKPRTRPNSFEGLGEEALSWIRDIQKTHKTPPFLVEVASSEHLDLALQNDITHIWIGARTSVNPFLVSEIAQAARGNKQLNVWIKNPMHPDVNLWLGSIERFENAGVGFTGAIHRGFFLNSKSPYRNEPNWAIPLHLKTLRNDIPILCDVSHISGNTALIPELVSTALWLNFDGFMMEVHPNPKKAFTDAHQQLSFTEFSDLLSWISSFGKLSGKLPDEILRYRKEIDRIDFEIIRLLQERMNLARQIGEIKSLYQIPVFQQERWHEILSSRPNWALQSGLPPAMIEKIWELIHNESISIQNRLIQKSVMHEDAIKSKV